jgi:hypothetical protein
MIDSLIEHIIGMTLAAKESPPDRSGRRRHVSTLYRWSRDGYRGVVLETIRIGRARYTSREALQRFYERLTRLDRAEAGPDPKPAPSFRTISQRKRASEEAARELDDRKLDRH